MFIIPNQTDTQTFLFFLSLSLFLYHWLIYFISFEGRLLFKYFRSILIFTAFPPPPAFERLDSKMSHLFKTFILFRLFRILLWHISYLFFFSAPFIQNIFIWYIQTLTSHVHISHTPTIQAIHHTIFRVHLLISHNFYLLQIIDFVYFFVVFRIFDIIGPKFRSWYCESGMNKTEIWKSFQFHNNAHCKCNRTKTKSEKKRFFSSFFLHNFEHF